MGEDLLDTAARDRWNEFKNPKEWYGNCSPTKQYEFFEFKWIGDFLNPPGPDCKFPEYTACGYTKIREIASNGELERNPEGGSGYCMKVSLCGTVDSIPDSKFELAYTCFAGLRLLGSTLAVVAGIMYAM